MVFDKEKINYLNERFALKEETNTKLVYLNSLSLYVYCLNIYLNDETTVFNRRKAAIETWGYPKCLFRTWWSEHIECDYNYLNICHTLDEEIKRIDIEFKKTEKEEEENDYKNKLDEFEKNKIFKYISYYTSSIIYNPDDENSKPIYFL